MAKLSWLRYISSDSVHEVCQRAAGAWAVPGEVDEAQALRPSEPAERKRLRKADGYGHGKLEVEEVLQRSGCRAVALRLPDVLGPFDDTYRLWAYWHWWRVGVPQVRSRKRPREDAEPVLAFVFSRDVARFCVRLLSHRGDGFDAVHLGCEEQLSLGRFLELMAKCMGLSSQGCAPCERPKSFFPSVERPYPLSFRKLKERYDFVCTPLEEVLRISTAWFLEACHSFPQEAAQAARKLPQELRAKAYAIAHLEPAESSSDSSS